MVPAADSLRYASVVSSSVGLDRKNAVENAFGRERKMVMAVACGVVYFVRDAGRHRVYADLSGALGAQRSVGFPVLGDVGNDLVPRVDGGRGLVIHSRWIWQNPPG